MMETRKRFTIVRELDAPRAAVWRAWTDPAIAARWWHPHGIATPPESVRIDLRVGGTFAYRMVTPDGSEYPTGGEYLELREPERLRCTWGDPGAAAGETMLITIDLVELEGGRSEMTFELSGIDERRVSEGGVRGGWSEAFEALDEALAVAR